MGSVGISSDEAVDSLIRAHIKKLQGNDHGEPSDAPFFIADTSKLVTQHSRWKRSLPEIQPFYAVKCNSDIQLLQPLDKLGANFDCASLEEIRAILGLGIDPSRIIFAQPCKPISALRFALERGVRLTTFDNIDELVKGQRIGFQMSVLDIGGGFQDHNFECMAAGLREALEREFPHGLPRLIAEPGRFYATSFYTMVCRVISRRTQAGPGSMDMLYQNDGLYGCFSGKWTEASVFTPILIQPFADKGPPPRVEREHRYSVWGPTCDSVDLVAEEMTFNCESCITV